MKLVCFLFSLITIFSSCASNSTSSDIEVIVNNNDISENVYVPNLYDGTGFGNDDGYYYIDIQESGVQNIKYIDYSTATETYLCNRPECTHDDETCSSVVTPYGGAVSVIPYNSYIFLLYTGSKHNDQYFEKYGSNALPHLERREPNGENAKTVISFSSNESTIGNIAFCGDSMYIAVRAIETENNKLVTKYYLYKYNLNSGNCISQLLLETPTQGIVAGNENYFILESISDGIADLSQAQNTYYKYCIDDNSMKVLTMANPRFNFVFLLGNDFYIVDKENNSIVCYDANVLEVKSTTNAFVANSTLGGVFCHTNDGVLLLTYSADGFEVSKEYYDLRSKTLKDITILNKYEEEYTNDAPMILAENDIFYLIVTDNYFENKGFYNPDGNIVTFLGPTYKKALITKEDYYANNRQLINIIEN